MICSRYSCSTLLFFALCVPALAGQIPVGEITYAGNTPDGSSVFHIILQPPPGVSFARLKPAFFTDGTGRSFVLPAPRSGSPRTYDFLFVTVPESGFTSCPCRSVSFLFAAPPGAKERFGEKDVILAPLSATFLSPSRRSRFLMPQQSTTIFLTTVRNDEGHDEDH